MEHSLRDDINHTSVQVLLTDASLALTFISIAETTTHGLTRQRNILNARTAYDSIQNLRVRYVLTEAEAATLDARLHEAKSRLELLGLSF